MSLGMGSRERLWFLTFPPPFLRPPDVSRPAVPATVVPEPSPAADHVGEAIVQDAIGAKATEPVSNAWGPKTTPPPPAPAPPAPTAPAAPAPPAPAPASTDSAALAYQFGQFNLQSNFAQGFGQGFGADAAAQPAADAAQAPAAYPYSEYNFYNLGATADAAKGPAQPAAPAAPAAPLEAQAAPSAPGMTPQSGAQQQPMGFPMGYPGMQPGMAYPYYYGYGYPQTFAYPGFNAPPAAAPYPSGSSAFPGAPNRAGMGAAGYGNAFGGYGGGAGSATAEDASAAYQAQAQAGNPYGAYAQQQPAVGRPDPNANYAANPYAANYAAYGYGAYGMPQQPAGQPSAAFGGLGK